MAECLAGMLQGAPEEAGHSALATRMGVQRGGGRMGGPEVRGLRSGDPRG